MRRYRNIFIAISLLIVFIALYVVCYVSSHIPSPSNSKSKVVHVSFDDVYLCLKDLKDNICYTSIFQQPFLGWLKDLHDNSGAVFSLYVYEKAEDYMITEVPDKFIAEFERNSSWLKFGWHAVKPNFDKEEQSHLFSNSIAKVNKIFRKKSLAPCLRLHYYYADYAMIASLKTSGIYYLLGADSEGRKSYNLNQMQSDSLFLMGSFYRDSIHYVKTDLRIEHMKYFPLELFNVQDKDTLTLFTHEWALVGKRNVFNRVKFEHSLKWLKNHDYKFSFFN